MRPSLQHSRGSSTTLRGIVHAHSLYSFDGRHTLPEISRAARNSGLSFVCMTEHSDTLDPSRVAEFVAECESLCGPDFLMIPGIEFTCQDNLHLLGIGVRSYDPSQDSVYLSHFIEQTGGISVLAHPVRKAYRIPEELLHSVHGIEVWNCGSDGGFVPHPGAWDLYARTRRSRPDLVAFIGCDLHQLSILTKITLRVSVASFTEASVLAALRAGAFTGRSCVYGLSGRPGPGQRAGTWLRTLRAGYTTAKTLRKRFQRT